LIVLGAERKIASRDAPRHSRHSSLDGRVVGADLDLAPTPKIEEDEPRLRTSR